MRYRTVNESVAFENWSSVITESTGVENKSQLGWMSTLLQIQENSLALEAGGNINESYGSQGPEAVPGMGDVRWPGVGQNPGDTMASGYQKGSGDMANRQLAIAMNVAAYTIGLELLPVIPMEFPSMMFGYLDHVYAGDLNQTKAEQGESEIFVELSGSKSGYAGGTYESLRKGDKVVLAQVPADSSAVLSDQAKALYGTFLGKHRLNGDPIIRYEGLVALTKVGAAAAERRFAISAITDGKPNEVLKVNAEAGESFMLVKGAAGGNSEVVFQADNTANLTDRAVSGVAESVSGDLVSAVDMHIPEFSKPGAEFNGTESYTATRERGEKGTQNIVSLRMFSTSVEAGTQEVLAELTRTQIKDLSVYGQDGMSALYKFAQGELTETMNRDILRTLFRLGVETASKLKGAQGIDLNLFIGDPAQNPTKDLSAFGIKEFRDINGVDRMGEFQGIPTAESNSSAENNATRSRRILSKILAASNIISTVGRHGKGDFAVMNVQVATAIQDIKGFRENPFDSTVTLDGKSLYSIGTVQGGIKIYVDPKMDWNDTRVLVGRKGTESDPGLKAFIYTLGESVETIGEASMAPKVLISSRYALVPAGFFPEAQYLTFAVNSDYNLV
jgi:hypothetical protein